MINLTSQDDSVRSIDGRFFQLVSEHVSIRPFNPGTDTKEAGRISTDYYHHIEATVSSISDYLKIPDTQGFVQDHSSHPGRLRGFILYTQIRHLRTWYDQDGKPAGYLGENKSLWEAPEIKARGIEYPQPTDLVILSSAVDRSDDNPEERQGMSAAFLNLAMIGKANELGLALVTYNWDKDPLLRAIYQVHGYNYLGTLEDCYAKGEHSHLFIRERTNKLPQPEPSKFTGPNLC